MKRKSIISMIIGIAAACTVALASCGSDTNDINTSVKAADDVVATTTTAVTVTTESEVTEEITSTTTETIEETSKPDTTEEITTTTTEAIEEDSEPETETTTVEPEDKEVKYDSIEEAFSAYVEEYAGQKVVDVSYMFLGYEATLEDSSKVLLEVGYNIPEERIREWYERGGYFNVIYEDYEQYSEKYKAVIYFLMDN